ncbi:hypothetical protein LOTGIDRAFT_153782 [Lottia gigantea]|uniref:Uncharacterized protein n=1 Tax=Lottia gigantea TaxID=225164 RepID=V4A3V3_LOTGI|nr:hypothetical protein LOTGIDRAFT_153782 [Lottia gigantea]ESO91347.1 hypothetical protein LOTGIDRAFT_153782 [Lottia gigantea]
MPTASQWQIIRKVTNPNLEARSAIEVPSTLADKLKSLQIKDEEDDPLGLKTLKNRITEGKSGNHHKKTEDPAPENKDCTRETQRVLEKLPKRLQSNLLRLGFRKSMRNMKRSFGQLVEDEIKEEFNETDELIKQLQTRQNIVPIKDMKPPDLKPKAVCFSSLGIEPTHLEVKKAVDRLLTTYPEIRLTTIEFQPRFKMVKTETSEKISRWVISFNTEWGRSRMTNQELILNGEEIVLKRYDEVVKSEFKQARRVAEIMMIVKNA